ncbi:Mitotic spindle checkpoint component mad2 [Actinomortierella ambigua]|nr:Mitotic spindle checkpoint component mad2 [Actinomortierella ambigua]
MQQQATNRTRINLRGSTKIIVEFFEYSINSLLFQRGLYAPENFKMTKKYGLNMLVTADPEVKAHIRQIMTQVEAWLMACKVEKLILAIKSKETLDVLERWQFDIHNTKDETLSPTVAATNDTATPSTQQPQQPQPAKPEKTEREIQMEIQAIMRQITASVTFLPTLDERCTWTILCQTEKDVEVPATWSDSDPHFVHNSEQVRLRSFSTNVHKVDALVAYRLQDNL